MEDLIEFMEYMLELMITDLYEQYVQVCENNWLTAMQGFNPGQLSIADQNIIPAIDDYLDETSATWVGDFDPASCDPQDYVDAVYDSYDSDVIDRAFSETTYQPLEAMMGIQQGASEVQDVLEIVQNMDLGELFD